MYIQITTVCNMACPHCIFACSPQKKGEHMSRVIFKKALAYANAIGSAVTLGGGEPTLHPEFWAYLGEAIATLEEGLLWMATNGTRKRTALALAKLAKAGVMGCALSVDSYHELDKVSKEVMQVFESVEIRNVDEHVINKGAAYENGVGDRDGCGCNTLHVKPNGDVFMCGCPNSIKLGGIEALENEALMELVREIGEETGECGDLDELSESQIQRLDALITPTAQAKAA